MINPELIRKVKDYFSLNIYETKVWMTLLAKGIASAGEISTASSVPRSRTYDVLESLEKRGFAIAKLGKPVKYIGIKPQVILEKLKNNVRKNAEDKIIELSKVRETGEFAELESLYKNSSKPTKDEDISISLKGKANISNNVREIMKNAKEEVIICTSVEEFISKLKLFEQTFEALKKKNVKLKIALSGDSKIIKKVSDKLGIKFTRININAKFFIVDRKEIMFYLSKNKDGEEVAIWLNSEFFSEAFATLFEKAMRV